MKTMMNENGRFACWMLRPLFAVAMLMVALPSWSATIDSVEFSSPSPRPGRLTRMVNPATK